MDKSKLIKTMHQFIAQLETDGYPVGFAGIPPVLPEYEMPYNLQIYSPKLLELGISQALFMLAHRRHEQLPIEARKLISRMEVCRKPEEIACRKEDIIVNKIKYKPLTIPYQMLEMA